VVTGPNGSSAAVLSSSLITDIPRQPIRDDWT